MAFQVVPNVASFKMIGTAESGAVPINNTIFVRNTELGWTLAHLVETATRIGDAWRDEICDGLNTFYLFDRVEYRDEGAEFGISGTVEYNQAGVRAGSHASPLLCALVKLPGAAGTAPRQGHLFISPLVEDDISASNLATAFVTFFQPKIDALDAAIGNINGDAWVIVSRYQGTDADGKPIKRAQAVSNTIGTPSLRSLIATQRDRRPGV